MQWNFAEKSLGRLKEVSDLNINCVKLLILLPESLELIKESLQRKCWLHDLVEK